MTLTPDALLTQSLQTSVDYQRCKLKEKDTQRAIGYLIEAEDALDQVSRRIKMIEAYDADSDSGQPWTLIHSKLELQQQAEVFQEKYEHCMEIYRAIIISLL